MKKNQQGFSLIELIIVVVIIGVIAAIAVPNLMASRRAANEGAAVSALRLIFSAEVIYQSSNGNYADFDTLYNARLIDDSLNQNPLLRSGYLFDIPATELKPATNAQHPQFLAVSRPIVIAGIPQTGTRRFGIVETGKFVVDSTQDNLGDHLTRSEVDNATPAGSIKPIN